jgi:predicted porin
MKKSIIALAVAGAMTAPIVAQADATIYGRVHERVVFQEDKDMNIQNAEARFGVKGSSEMDSGLTAFYQIEMALRGDGTSARQSNSSRSGSSSVINADDTSKIDTTSDIQFRQLNAGVKGDFGTAIIGRFTNPYVDTYTGDIFEGESGVYQLAPFRVGNAIGYTTPDYNGMSASVAIIGEGEGVDTTYEDVDGYIVKVKGAFGPVSVALAYMDTEYTNAAATSDEADLSSIGLAYNANGLYVGLGYEEDDVSKTDVIDFGVKYTVGKTAFGLGYAVEDSTGSAEKDRVVLGVYHDLGGSADVYTELAKHDETTAAGVDSDFNRFSVGYRVKF